MGSVGRRLSPADDYPPKCSQESRIYPPSTEISIGRMEVAISTVIGTHESDKKPHLDPSVRVSADEVWKGSLRKPNFAAKSVFWALGSRIRSQQRWLLSVFCQ